MTTTELIKILQDNEAGAISHKPREISLTINGSIYLPNPQITVLGTGDGICGAEIDLDIEGEWLEQESCDDAISRQAVLEMAYDMSEIDGEHFTDQYMVVDVKDIQKLPPVTQKSETVTEFADRCRECGKMRKGHWTNINSENFEFHRVYKCSECGNVEIEYPEDIYRHFRYCPNCGAKMAE